MARVREVAGVHVGAASLEWQMAEVPVDAKGKGGAELPSELDARALRWLPASAPGTVASALEAVEELDWSGLRSFDASDYWWRARVARPASKGDDERLALRLEGLASVADVFWNGERLLRSDSMFHAHRFDVTERFETTNELAIRFRALAPLLGERRPRPRWRTKLVANQQLRYWRTTLLGRIPGWSPPVACVGPYRPVLLEQSTTLRVEGADLRTRVEGEDGVVTLRLTARAITGAAIGRARLFVGEHASNLSVRRNDDGSTALEGELRIPKVALWWPATHGAQPLYPASVVVDLGEPVEMSLGELGFRTLTLERDGGAFTLLVNGAPIFCRGACWTTADYVTLGGDDAPRYDALVARAAEGGMNMLRVGGTMTYEADAFYDACTRRGVLVWQDFMFANLDYPATDGPFVASVQREARELLDRTQAAACLAILCGNSEIEQQVAMLGLPREQWQSPLFTEVLPAVAGDVRPDVPYVPSSPTGGDLPFQVDQGLSHYYGVGAYLRPLEDARRANVRFTSECLGFANVPDDVTLEKVLADGEAPIHHPAWKRRVPRDAGPGWDFDDVRDHYMRLLFGVDPLAVRYADVDRYLALARVTTGEVMAATLGEWRRPGSTCRGALLWFFRDLWAGAGWGIVGADDVPKAAYYYVRRAMQPVALFASDEGLNGVDLHAVNDGPTRLEAELRLTLWRGLDVKVAEATAPVDVPARGSSTVRAHALFEHFIDTTYAYRFGPPAYQVAAASLRDRATGAPLGEAFHFPAHVPNLVHDDDLGLEAAVVGESPEQHDVRIRAKRFAHAIALEVPGWLPDDNYFSLAPEGERLIHFRRRGDTPRFRGTARALNARVAVSIRSRLAV